MGNRKDVGHQGGVMIWTVWLLIVLAGAWLVSKIEDLMEKAEEKKRNEEIHRMLIADIVRGLNGLDSDNTGEERQSE
jgi:hypothetical protein